MVKIENLLSKQIQVIDRIKEDENSLLTSVDIKYQDIEYCMHSRNKTVYYNRHEQIDFQLAISELKSLEWTLSQNGISFHNNKTDQSIFCHRLTEDKWLVLTPIKTDGVWTGYEWVSYPETNSLIKVLKLYFEENLWFYSLNWKEVKWTNDFEC